MSFYMGSLRRSLAAPVTAVIIIILDCRIEWILTWFYSATSDKILGVRLFSTQKDDGTAFGEGNSCFLKHYSV